MTSPPEQQSAIAALKQAVERLHGGTATFIHTVPVHEQFRGETVWKGSVSEFDLSGHPSATRCYAWSVDAGGKDRFYAVLGTGAIDSAAKAAQASIVAEFKAGRP